MKKLVKRYRVFILLAGVLLRKGSKLSNVFII